MQKLPTKLLKSFPIVLSVRVICPPYDNLASSLKISLQLVTDPRRVMGWSTSFTLWSTTGPVSSENVALLLVTVSSLFVLVLRSHHYVIISISIWGLRGKIDLRLNDHLTMTAESCDMLVRQTNHLVIERVVTLLKLFLFVHLLTSPRSRQRIKIYI